MTATHRWTAIDTAQTVAPAFGALGVAACFGPSWVAVGILAAYAVGEAVLLAIAERAVRVAIADASEARAAESEAKASEGMVRNAAESALGNCAMVRPERTLTGDLVLHVIPPGSGVEISEGVELWHVHTGREDVSKVGRS